MLSATTDAFEVMTAPVPSLSTDAATSILDTNYCLHGALTPLTSERDQNFLLTAASGDRFVLKIANSAEDPAVTDFQTAALVYLADAAPEQPVPRVVMTAAGADTMTVIASDGRRHRVRLLTWLDGVPLQYADRAPDYAHTLGACLARLGQALAGFEHPGSDYALLWDLKGASRLRRLLEYVDDPDLRALCRTRLERFETAVLPKLGGLRWQVIHNDLNPSNVLVDPAAPGTVTGIIDFGDMVRSPLVVDVAVACAYLLQDSDDPLADVERFIGAYCAIEPLDAAELGVLFDLILTRSTMTILITHWRAAQYPENRDYILRNEPVARKMLKIVSGAAVPEVVERFRAAAAAK